MLIELKKITKKFGSVTALHEVNLEVGEGEFLTLLGPTGCGKTTLLRIIAGFVEPTSGEVILGGHVINHVPPSRRQVGLLFQNYALFPHMTAEENVAFGLRTRGIDRFEIQRKVDEVLKLLGIEGLRGRYPSQLSGGQQQRVALARTLAIEPRLLLLDEPLAALDRKLRLEMQVELKKLVSRVGITTICVSHDQDEALTMSDRIALMNQGGIEQIGLPLELYDRPRTTFAASFLGNSNLLRGRILRDSQGAVFFESGRLHMALPDWKESSADNITLLLRPEHLCLASEATGDSFAGTVSFITHFGHSTHYEVRLDAGPVILAAVSRSQDRAHFKVGDHVFVTPNGTAAYQLIKDGSANAKEGKPSEV